MLPINFVCGLDSNLHVLVQPKFHVKNLLILTNIVCYDFMSPTLYKYQHGHLNLTQKKWHFFNNNRVHSNKVHNHAHLYHRTC